MFADLFQRLTRLAPDLGDGAPGASPASAPAAPPTAPPPADEVDTDGPSLVRDSAAAGAAADAASITAEAALEATPPAPAAPEVPATPPAAPVAPPPDATAELRTLLQAQARELAELKAALLRPATSPTPPTPTPPAAPLPAAPEEELSDADLIKMQADDYEVDPEKDAPKLARELLATRKAMAKLRSAAGKPADVETVARRVAAEELQRVDGQRQYEELQRSLPQQDLADLYRQAYAQAQQEGYAQAGDAAVLMRAGQIWNGKVAALKAAPPAPAPAPAPAVKPAAGASPKPAVPPPPAAPVTPNGAQPRVGSAAGHPQRPVSSVPTEEDIDSRHTLVRR